jgi:hypothetical protein
MFRKIREICSSKKNEDKITLKPKIVSDKFWSQNSFMEKRIEPYTSHTLVEDNLNENSTYGTKNMFIESHYELNISLFERELTESIVNNAYEKCLNEHISFIQKGEIPIFEISAKREARDYLIKTLENIIKP